MPLFSAATTGERLEGMEKVECHRAACQAERGGGVRQLLGALRSTEHGQGMLNAHFTIEYTVILALPQLRMSLSNSNPAANAP